MSQFNRAKSKSIDAGVLTENNSRLNTSLKRKSEATKNLVKEILNRNANLHNSPHLNQNGDNDSKHRQKKSISTFFSFIENSKRINSSDNSLKQIVIKKTRWQRISQKCKQILSSTAFTIFTSIIVLLDLFLDDVRVISLSKEHDSLIDALIFTVAVYFIFDTFLSCLFIDNYLFSFFFYMDVLSTASMFPYFGIFSENSNPDIYSYEDSSDTILSIFIDTSNLTNASKASLAGSRISRFYSILKVLRIFSFGRFYKHNLDNMIKKNDQYVLKAKLKHHRGGKCVKRKRRRSTINIKDLDEKLGFFKKVHNILQLPKLENYNVEEAKLISPSVKSIRKSLKSVKSPNSSKKSRRSKNIDLMSQSSKKESIAKYAVNRMPKKDVTNIINTNLEDSNAKLLKQESSRGIMGAVHGGLLIQPKTNTNVFAPIRSPEKRKFKTLHLTDKRISISCEDLNIQENQLSKKKVNIPVENNEADNMYYQIENFDKSNNTIQQIDGKYPKLNDYEVSGFKFMRGFADEKKPSYPRFMSKAKTSSLPKRLNHESSQLNTDNANTILHNNYFAKKQQTTLSDYTREVTKSIPYAPFILKFFETSENEMEDDSRLARKISRMVTIQVVFIILLILFVNPVLNPDNYSDFNSPYQFHKNYLSSLFVSSRYDILMHFLNKTFYDEQYKLDQDIQLIEFGFTNNLTRYEYNVTELFVYDRLYYNESLMNETRVNDRVYISNRYFYLVYNKTYENFLHSLLNIIRVICTAFCLWLFSFSFVYNVNKYVVIPLEDLFSIMRNEKITTDLLYHNNISANEEANKLNPEGDIYEGILDIEKFFRNTSCLIIRSIGIRFYNYFKARILAESDINFNADANFRLRGFLMILKIRNFYDLVKQYDCQFSALFSKILNIIDLTVYENFGEIIKIDNDTIFIFFDQENLKIEQQIDANNSNDSTVKDSIYYLANFSLISAIKIITRIRFFIENEHIDINILLDRTSFNYVLINTNEKLDPLIYSRRLKHNLKTIVIFYITLG
jgi:hypothetical protein